VTQTLAAQGDGTWKEYAGGYSDYLRQRAPVLDPLTRGSRSEAQRGVSRPRTKLSYKESRELEALPAEIDALEAEQKSLFARMHDPEYYRQPPETLRADQARSAEIEALLMQKLERWHALEDFSS
jgi:ATP-binding cassette subfamily F protein uup